MIGWQADTVRRLGIEKLYYSLPKEEYLFTIKPLMDFLDRDYVEQIEQILESHYLLLKQKILDVVNADVEFIHPIQKDNSLSMEQSYVWPYKNLDIELGIEEMEEILIPYQAMKSGAIIPPILFGMLGMPCPYYERREYDDETDYICLNL